MAGLLTSTVAPLSASHQRPPMYACCRKRSGVSVKKVSSSYLLSLRHYHMHFQAKEERLRILAAQIKKKSTGRQCGSRWYPRCSNDYNKQFVKSIL